MHNFGKLYECECDYLNRMTLTCRNDFEESVVKHITTTYLPSDVPHLTYITHAPGGLLADARIIQHLISHGYRALIIICIEPLYQKNMSILQACLDFTKWCSQQTTCSIKIHWYTSPKEYAQACATTSSLRGHVYLCIDPDDTKTRPHFGSYAFRRRFEEWCRQVLHSQSSFYYLYFQAINDIPYRHRFIGTRALSQNKCSLHLEHSYGERMLNEKSNSYFFNISTRPSSVSTQQD